MARSLPFSLNFKRLVRDRRGNFAVMSALLLPVGLGLAGLAIDTTAMITTKAALQNAADAAALAAATAMANDKATVQQAEALAVNFITGQMANHATSGTPFDYAGCTNVTTTETPTAGTGKKYNVTVETCEDVTFTSFSVLMGKAGTTIHVKSSTEAAAESKEAVSMYLVLDRSGSMGEFTTTVKGTGTCKEGRRYVTCKIYYTKIEALRIAATNLMNQLAMADPTISYVRMGAVSYNDKTQTPTNLTWGVANAKTYIAALTSTGGTDSTVAFKTGHQALNQASEDTVHQTKNGQVPKKTIVFMTDGDNNYTSADTYTKQWCDAARNAGIEVYSVAFMAPDRGKALLNYCATTAGHYFAAENATQLNAAFEYVGQQSVRAASRLTQ